MKRSIWSHLIYKFKSFQDDFHFTGNIAFFNFSIIGRHIKPNEKDILNILHKMRHEIQQEIGYVINETLGPECFVEDIKICEGSISVALIVGAIEFIVKYKDICEAIMLLKRQIKYIIIRFLRNQGIIIDKGDTVEAQEFINPNILPQKIGVQSIEQVHYYLIQYLIYSNIAMLGIILIKFLIK